jgi:hypothetical protein
MEPPTRFAYRWHPHAIDPDTNYSGEPLTLVEFVLSRHGDATSLTVTESGFEALPAARRFIARDANEGGWAIQVARIKAHAER